MDAASQLATKLIISPRSSRGRREGQEDEADGLEPQQRRPPARQEARRQGLRRPARARRLRAGQPALHEDPARMERECPGGPVAKKIRLTRNQ